MKNFIQSTPQLYTEGHFSIQMPDEAIVLGASLGIHLPTAFKINSI